MLGAKAFDPMIPTDFFAFHAPEILVSIIYGSWPQSDGIDVNSMHILLSQEFILLLASMSTDQTFAIGLRSPIHCPYENLLSYQ